MEKKVQTATDRCRPFGMSGYDFVISVLTALDSLGPGGDYIVHIRTKHTGVEEWDDMNELLLANDDDSHTFQNDWWEGEPCVEVLGAVEVDDVVVPDFITEQEN